jgi:membrane protease YdiL (CAAX protease family)
MNLPVSALGAFCPLFAALILVHKEEKPDGVRRLLRRVFDYSRIKKKLWYIPIIFLMPVIILLSYREMRLSGMSLPKPQIPFASIPVLFIVFFIAAIGEETGWTGYVTEPLLGKWSALKTGIIMGILWAVWHFIPFIQTHHSITWVLWQCFTTILLRIIIVWLYSNTGKSLFAAVVFHDMINVSDTLFPNNGSHYDPAVTGVFLLITVVIITFLWGSKTLSRFRYAR